MTKIPQIKVIEAEVDGVWVVEIDTDPDEDAPRIRVYLNDSCLYEDPKFPEV